MAAHAALRHFLPMRAKKALLPRLFCHLLLLLFIYIYYVAMAFTIYAESC